MRGQSWFLIAALVSIATVCAQDPQGPQAPEQGPPEAGRGVARIGLVNGEVNVRRGDSGDWVAATANAPLMVEDHIATAPGSRAEVQFDAGNFLRLGASTEAQMAQLEANRYQIQVARGTVDFSVLRASNADIEIDTPAVSVRPRDRGAYRITVMDNGESEVTVRAGRAEIYTPRGVETVAAGQTMLVRGDPANPEFQTVAAIAPDDWDRWNADRDRRMEGAGAQVYNRYVSPDEYGAESMEGYGRWAYAPDYGGYVWAPSQSAGWAPYQNGRWVWEDYYGWTWVSYDPWGWAPYHYGRWFFNAGYGGWCWWPGSIRAHYWWAPAYVGFFGFGSGFGVGFGFGNVGWVPLAPFEAFHPWWGRGFGGFHGRTTIVNNVNIYNTYRNARVMNGATAVASRDFGAGRFSSRVPVTANSLRGAGLVQGHMGITPTAQNLRFSDRAAANVPRASANQRFFTHNPVATGQRTPFGQQRAAGSSPAAGSGSYRPMNTNPTVTGGRGNGLVTPQRSAPQTALPSAGNRGVTSGGGSNGWHRFGEPGAAASPGNTNRGTAPSYGGGWQRFGSPNSTPQYRGTPQYSRPSAPQYSRPSTPPSYSGPSAPSYSRPSAPPSYSRPSPSYGGGGGRSYGGGGGGSHNSGGGGGSHSSSHGGGRR